MNNKENRDWARRLQEIEAQMNQSSPKPQGQTQPGQSVRSQNDNSQSIQPLLKQVPNWFNGLSSAGKVVAISAAAIVGLVVLKTIFQLVAWAIGLALLAAILFLVYKLFVASSAHS